MSIPCWLVKQEPEDYSWEDLVRDGSTAWTGVRNFAARAHLRRMQKGDVVFLYHSGKQKQIVGTAKVARAAYPDPTATDGDWVCVDLEPLEALPAPVPLAIIKQQPALRNFALVRQSRLSVMPVASAESRILLNLASKTS